LAENKKLKFRKSRVKTILIIFLDSQGIMHTEFVPEGKTVNAEVHKGVVAPPSKAHSTGFVQLRSVLEIFFLLYDNAPAHTAAGVCKF
jgi:hypothetical protein